MAENEGTSVGTISLDLVIKNRLGEQLGKIKSMTESPARQIGESIQEAIEKPLENAVRKPAEKAGETIREAIEKPVDEISEFVVSRTNSAMKNIQKSLDTAQISSNPTEKLVKELEITEGKISGLTNRWKALQKELENTNNNFEVSKIDDKLNKVESQLLRLGASADKLKEKINRSLEGENSTNDIDSRLTEIFNRLKNFEVPATPVQKLQTELEITYSRLDLLQKKWHELSAAELSDKTAEQMLKIQQQIISTESAADVLIQKLFELNQSNIESAEESADRITDDAWLNKSTVEKIAEELFSFATAGFRAIPNTANTIFDSLKTAFSSVKDFIKTGLISIGHGIKTVYDKIKYYLENPLYFLKDAAKVTFSAIKNSGKIAFNVLKKTGSATFSVLKKGFNVLKSAGGKALDSLKSRFSFLNKSAAGLVKPVEKLGRTLKNTFRRVFVMATLYAGVRAIKDTLGEAMKANEEFSKSLNEVKANLNIAFTPIIQAAMPAINTLMSGLAAVTKRIAAFTANLFGMTYRQAAEATQKIKNTAETAADTAKKTEKAIKKVRMSMAGIDEMNILSDDSGDSPGSSSDNSADEKEDDSGIDFSKLDLSEPELPDWAERLKTAIKSGDWYGVGEVFAERVNSVFESVNWADTEEKIKSRTEKICDLINGFLDNVNWSALGEAVAGGINSVTSVINTFAEKIHWDNLGKNLANGLNTAIQKIKWKELGKAISAKIRILTDLLYGFVTEFDWKGLGNGIGEAINGWIDNIDFGKLGRTFSEGIKGIFDTANSMLKRIDFRSIGVKIGEFINNIDIAGIISRFAAAVSNITVGLLDTAIGLFESIDWGKLGDSIYDSIVGIVQNIDWNTVISKVFELLGAAVGGSAMLIGSVLLKLSDALHEAWENVKDYFDEKIEEAGGNIWEGVLNGILDALKNIGKWIKENIFKPFMEGFRKAFDIHSPSKKMAEMGGFLIDGLFGAISDGMKKIKEIFEKMREKIYDVFEKSDEWFKEKFTSARTKIKNVFSSIGTWFGSRWDDIQGAFSDTGSWFSDTFQNARKNAESKFEDVGDWFDERWSDIKGAFSDSETDFKNVFTNAWNGMTSVFSRENTDSHFDGILNTALTAFGDIKEKFKSKFSDAFQGVKDAFSGIGDFFRNLWENDIKSKFSGIGTTVGGAIGDAFKTAVNSVLATVENQLNFVPNAINSALQFLTDLTGKSYFLMDPIRLPKLAKGGLAKAPTLAMVGDNRNAAADPEVIAPLSKLQGMIGSDNPETVKLLNMIVELLRGGISAELNSSFGNDFRRAVLKITADDRARRGG